MRRAILIAAGLVLLAAAAGCGGSSGSGGSGGTTAESEGGKTTVAGVEANNHGSQTVGDEAKLELDDDYFEPTVIKGKAGSSVKLELENEGQAEHNFSIDAQGIDQDVEPGEDATVTVKMPKSGTISFFCKYHKSAGMAGALQVGGGSGGMTDGGTTTNGGGGKGY